MKHKKKSDIKLSEYFDISEILKEILPNEDDLNMIIYKLRNNQELTFREEFIIEQVRMLNYFVDKHIKKRKE